MQRPTASGCARAKGAISAVLQLKAVLRAAPLLAAALTASGQEPPTNALLTAIVGNLTDPGLAKLEARIDAVIDDDATFAKRTSQRMLECLFAVRAKRAVPKLCRSPPRTRLRFLLYPPRYTTLAAQTRGASRSAWAYETARAIPRR